MKKTIIWLRSPLAVAMPSFRTIGRNGDVQHWSCPYAVNALHTILTTRLTHWKCVPPANDNEVAA